MVGVAADGWLELHPVFWELQQLLAGVSKELAGIVRDLMTIGNYLTPAAKTLPIASYSTTAHHKQS